MPSLTLDNSFIWFAHCPKAGGTSIETLMVETWGARVGHLHWGWDLWWRKGGWRKANPPNSPQHLTWADATKQFVTMPDVVFAMVRDPATRMMSEHRYQRCHRRGTWAGRVLAFLPFALWLRVMLSVVKRYPHAFDNHLRPQSDFVPPHGIVFHLEDGLEVAVDWLAHLTQRPVSAHYHTLKSGPASPPDPASLALIAAAFADDYDRFGYVPPKAVLARAGLYDKAAACLAPLVGALDRRGLL